VIGSDFHVQLVDGKAKRILPSESPYCVIENIPLIVRRLDFEGDCMVYIIAGNLVPRACDPREVTRGSGIIRFREESDWPLKWMRSSILATIPGFRQRIIPEPRVPFRGSQARGTRLNCRLIVC
jgi:hypothetical protein